MSHYYCSEHYNYQMGSEFAMMTNVCGIIGMALAVIIAPQLAGPKRNYDTPWLVGNDLNNFQIQRRMQELRFPGFPCSDVKIANAPAELIGKKEMLAKKACLQSLGSTLKGI